MSKNSFMSAKRIFSVPKLNTKRICAIGLLIAITFVLSAISGYLRLGTIGKLSISFVSVFVASYAFGGVIGGLVAVIADVISFLVNPVGAFIPFLTMIEFVYGFAYGFFFFGLEEKKYSLCVAVCDLFQLFVNVFLKTLVLSAAFGMPYAATLIGRVPMCLLQFVLIFVVLILIKPFVNKFKQL